MKTVICHTALRAGKLSFVIGWKIANQLQHYLKLAKLHLLENELSK
jgi:hypothetical protein